MTSNSTSATKGRAWFSGSETRPSLLVYYRCTNGLENYYTYQTAGAGNAGISYISDYTGQLTQAIPIVSYASAVNPFSLTMYYNSSYSLYHGDTAYDVGGQQNLAMVLGAGVGMNIMQCMTTVEVENSTASSGKTTCLRLTDGDGTWHYFAEDSRRQSGYYYDEDGLGLKVYPYAANCYKVYEDDGSNTTDTGDYRMLFVNGHLRELRDQNGNILRINYKNGDPTLTGDRITSVTQINSGCSAITVATFAYYSDVGTLKSITDAAGFRYQFSYVNNNGTLLESIARNETTIARYTYSGKRMTSAYDAERQQGIAFTYADGKLSGYREYDGSNQTGTEISVSYPGSGQTCYSDRNGVCTIYSFDYAGRTVNACTKNASGKVLGASNAVYSGIGTTDQTNNRTLRTASIGVAAMNELRDHGFESASSDWTLSGTSADGSTNTNIVIRAMTGSGELVRAGTSACKGWVTAGSGATVSVKRSTNRLYRNKTYTFSAYVNTSKCSSFSGSGICLRLENSSGTSLASSEPLNYKTDSAIDGGWVRLSFTYTPTASGNYVLALYDHGAGPYFYTDDWQVEASETPSNLNLLENGNLQHWGHGWSVNAAEFYAGEGLNAVSEDAYSIRIQGDAYTNAYAYQDVPINQTGGSYVLSGWAKANAVPDNVQTATGDDAAARDTNKQFGLRAVVTYADSTTEYHYAPFCADVKAWQFTSLAIVPKQADKKVDSIRVICAYEKNDNTALFDELSLTREAAQSMTYDENGNLVSVKSTGTADETAAYENGNLISVKTGGSGTFTYEYDDNNNVTGTSNGVIRQDYTRNAQGAVTETKLTADSGSGSAISAQTAYTGGSNLVSSQTDSRGNAVTYSYPESIYKMLGVPYNTTDANGTTRRTIYDTTTGRFSMTYIPSVISIANTYNSKGQVSTITRAGYYDGSRVTQEYGMTYDSFGNTTGISVGSRTLSACEYEENNGNLAKQTYGNGAYTQFQYDELDRISRAITSDGDTYSYSYTGDGQLYQINDTAGGLAYQYTYDTIGRLVGTSQIGGSVGLRASYGYDDANRLTKFAYSIPGVVDSAEESFYYNESSTDSISDGTLTGMALLSNEWIYYRYDSLSRLSERDVAGILTEHQTYLAGTSGNTTTLPETFYTTAKGGTAKLSGFQYGYDALGNITKITDLTDHSYTQYTYDQQGQVTSAKAYNASGTLQKEETYTYDSYGNLRSSSSPEGNHTYTYGDSDWRDLLTAYDGVSITYDGSGNPLTYYNGKNYTMTWRNGRELNTVTTGGKTYSYEYDVNGLRTRKTNADGGYTEYYIVDGLAVAERRFYSGGAEFYTMRYYFDESNSPVGFGIQYASEASTYWDNYYFAKNGQGDVISLYHSVYNSGSASYSGTLVATYKYDTWGKPLGIYNASGNEISQSGSNVAALNPFRYRGYRYDADTGFYYLQRRYYDPEIGRFINADSYTSTGQDFLGYNMFAYCGNNPVCGVDASGTSWWHWVAAAAITAVAIGAVVVTAGGAASALFAMSCVANGVAVSSTAVTVTAGVAVGAGTALAVSAYSAANEADTLEEFADYGEAALVGTVVGGTVGGITANNLSGHSCFIAGTQICTEFSSKNIEDIEIGDYVWAWDEESGDVALKPVVETYVNETESLVHLSVSGEEIVCTPTHPFYSPVKGWTDAVHLRAGDILVLVNGEYVVVEKVQHEILESPVKVYNFQVADYHTYYVANAGVLVHNSCNHGKEWTKKRRSFWKNSSKTATVGQNYGAYTATFDNIDRMSDGLAPIGWDGHSVNLHHWDGIANDFYNYSPVSWTLHRIIHFLIK